MAIAMPGVRPASPHFSSGPCAKRPGWSLQALTDAALGRSHRAKLGKAKLKRSIDLTREVLRIPADYRIGIVPASDTGAHPAPPPPPPAPPPPPPPPPPRALAPASDTGAVEMALWSLLGARPV